MINFVELRILYHILGKFITERSVYITIQIMNCHLIIIIIFANILISELK